LRAPIRLMVCVAILFLSAPAVAETLAGRASVIDGDTLEIHGERIRILDIDAPESRQKCTDKRGIDIQVWFCGSEAGKKLANLIGARTITCETTRKDRYKRWLARCSVASEDLSLWLAEHGWVFPFRNCKCEVIRAAVDRARSQQLGIWSGDVQEPWEWRKAN
jgi:endonuclease YncB( thermonuclease family)